MESRLIFATRPSALARWQTRFVIQELHTKWSDYSFDELLITTKGDRELAMALPEIGRKGLFTAELEEALGDRQVDAAVHSLKDLPTDETPGLIIGAILPRADARDVLVCPSGFTLDELPAESIVGTSSNRRQAQLLAYRPDLRVQAIRGNIDTRLRKVQEGQYVAAVLAAAGIIRLNLQEQITQYLPPEVMLSAPGQGALAVQCREDDEQTLRLLSAIEHTATRKMVIAERAFLSGLGGGCSLPVGAYAEIQGEDISLQGVVASPDGKQTLKLVGTGNDPYQVGMDLAQKALKQGADRLIHY